MADHIQVLHPWAVSASDTLSMALTADAVVCL
jgi:hypothetical protein